EFREAVVQALEAARYFVDTSSAYTPHTTLAYVPSNAPTPITSVPTVPLYLHQLCLVIGSQRYTFDLATPDLEIEGAVPIGASDEMRSTDYKHRREVAIRDIRAGRPMRAFVYTYIPEAEQQSIERGLATCKTVDEVKMLFRFL